MTTELDRAQKQAKIEDAAIPSLRTRHAAAVKARDKATAKEFIKWRNTVVDYETQIKKRVDTRDENAVLAKSLQARLDQLPPIEKAMQSLNGKGQIEFRIFAQCGEAEFELLRSTGYKQP